MKKIIVTGGLGFIGSNLIKLLLKSGYFVINIDRVSYASNFYNFDFGVHLGKYLAKDNGATFEIRRTFDNGSSIGAFATFTNVSPEDFGEGSFDKGIYIKIPYNNLEICKLRFANPPWN